MLFWRRTGLMRSRLVRPTSSPSNLEQPTPAQEAVRLAEVRYRKYRVAYLGVLDAQRTALAAETQLVLTEHTPLTDMVSLFKALGGGCAPPSTGQTIHE